MRAAHRRLTGRWPAAVGIMRGAGRGHQYDFPVNNGPTPAARSPALCSLCPLVDMGGNSADPHKWDLAAGTGSVLTAMKGFGAGNLTWSQTFLGHCQPPPPPPPPPPPATSSGHTTQPTPQHRPQHIPPKGIPLPNVLQTRWSLLIYSVLTLFTGDIYLDLRPYHGANGHSRPRAILGRYEADITCYNMAAAPVGGHVI